MWNLLVSKKFSGFFWTMFLGAFNDNVFKNAMVLLLIFRSSSEEQSGMISNLAAACFILPYFLFSPLAGQISDKLPKHLLIERIKFIEIFIVAVGAIGFWTGNPAFLMMSLFALGTQSAFFGPVKYSLLPEVLKQDELVTGNSLVEMGTFLAILLGTILGGLLSSRHPALIGSSIITLGVLGWLTARVIPPLSPASPNHVIQWNPIPEMVSLYKIARSQKSVFLCILGISWFWFFGSVVLTQLPVFCKHFLGGQESLVTLLLATFSIAIGLGSIACEKLSRKEIELGLVPLGAFGMSVFCAGLYFIDYPYLTSEAQAQHLSYTLSQLFEGHSQTLLSVASCILGIGISGALFIVPLFAMIQDRSESQVRSRVIAANNILNAAFMVMASILTILGYKIGMSTTELLLGLACFNVLMTIYIFLNVPEFTLRFIIWILASTIYSIKYRGRDLLPKKGAAILAPNHVSFIDWFIITALCRRPLRFVMYYTFYEIPLAKIIFKLGGCIPIASEKDSPEVKEKAFKEIDQALQDGDLICIFPEGEITRNGELSAFKRGIENIQKRHPTIPVYPVGMSGLWGSFFSRSGKGAFKGVPKPHILGRDIVISVGEPLHELTSAADLQTKVQALLKD